MKNFLIKVMIDLVFILLSILIFKDESFIFCGIGIIILGILLYKQFNKSN